MTEDTEPCSARDRRSQRTVAPGPIMTGQPPMWDRAGEVFHMCLVGRCDMCLVGRCDKCDVDLTSAEDVAAHLRAFHPNYRPGVEFHRSTWALVLTAVTLGLALAAGVVWYVLTGGAR